MQEAARGALKAAMDIDIKGKTQAHTAHTSDTHTNSLAASDRIHTAAAASSTLRVVP